MRLNIPAVGMNAPKVVSYCCNSMGNNKNWKVKLLLLTSVLCVAGHFLINRFLPLKSDLVSAEDILIKHNPNQGDRGLKMAMTSTWSSSQQQEFHVKSSAANLEFKKSSNEKGPTTKHVREKIKDSEIHQKTNAVFDNNGSSNQEKKQELQFKIRNERIKRVCQRWGVVTNAPIFVTHTNSSMSTSTNLTEYPTDVFEVETPNTSHFLLAPSYQTMSCVLNKVASSSLVSAFLLVHGLGPSFSSPHSLTFHLLPRSLEDFKMANDSYFKFMFVRHPMDRMLSCYMDKMVESPHISLPPFRAFVRNKAREIIRNRKHWIATQHTISGGHNSPSRRQTQQRRLLFVIQEAEIQSRRIAKSQVDYGHWGTNDVANKAEYSRHYLLPQYPKSTVIKAPNFKEKEKSLPLSPPFVNTNKNSSARVVPTFEEFIEFVLSTDLQGLGYDAHWVPFHRYCTPCSVKYHAIGKLENGAEDFEYIWKKTGMESEVPIPWVNRNKAPPSKRKIDLEKKYYSSLPRELILRFYEAFRMDFELFDYSIDEILIKAGYEPIKESNIELNL